MTVRTSAASAWEFGERYDTSRRFVSPIANPPRLNSAGSGKNVPVKFSLGRNEGLSILAAGSPTSAQIACPEGLPVSGPEQLTRSTGGLSFDAVTGAYQYNWKTEKSWAGTCRRLTVRFREGSTLTALFSFK